MSRSVLVLGAKGFIGRAVMRALDAADDFHPVAAGRSQSDDDAGLRLDMADPAALTTALGRAEALVDCTAGSPQAMNLGTANLFRAAESAGRPPVVVFSSMAVYGNETGLVNEAAPLSGEQGDYAAAKLALERLAAAYGRAVVLRPGCVYGPGGVAWSLRIARLLRSGRIGDLGAGGDGFANLVHVDDVARAVVEALRRSQAVGQSFNLAMADPPTWNDYFLSFSKALGHVPLRRLPQRRMALESKVLAAPLKILEILAGRLGLSSLALPLIPPPIPPSLARLWRQEIRLDPAKAERELGLGWTPLDQGLAETAAWCRSAGG